MDTNKNPPYMFLRPEIDYFFRWRWWAAPVAFLPVSVALIAYAISAFSLSLFLISATFAVGFLLWTLFEYGMHRFLFHFIGRSPSLRHMHYIVHGMHHAHPTDPVRVIFPPFGSVIVGILVGGIFFCLLSKRVFAPVFAGFISGYVWYEFIHYASHHIKWKVAWLKRLKRHHLLHHHSMGYRNQNFGVTTTLWDRAFGTYLAKTSD